MRAVVEHMEYLYGSLFVSGRSQRDRYGSLTWGARLACEGEMEGMLTIKTSVSWTESAAQAAPPNAFVETTADSMTQENTERRVTSAFVKHILACVSVEFEMQS